MLRLVSGLQQYPTSDTPYMLVPFPPPLEPLDLSNPPHITTNLPTTAVATIVQSGLQISTDAYTPLWTGRHPHVEGLVQQRAQVRRFSSESQQRLAGETRRLRIEGRLVMMGTTTAGTPSGTQTCTGSDKKKVHRRNTSSGRRKRSSVTLASTETTVNTTAVDVAGGVVDTDAVGAQVLVKKGKPRVRRRRTAEKAMNDPPEDEIADE